jgi:hypothetical protein
LIKPVIKPTHLRQDSPSGLHKQEPCVCGANTARMTVEKAGLQNVFEFLQAFGQRRLGDPQHRRGLQETAVSFQGVHRSQQ